MTETRGCVDSLSFMAIEGWAWDPSNADRAVTVALFKNDAAIAKTRANYLRLDVRDAGFGTGLYGFKLRFEFVPFREEDVFQIAVLDALDGEEQRVALPFLDAKSREFSTAVHESLKAFLSAGQNISYAFDEGALAFTSQSAQIVFNGDEHAVIDMSASVKLRLVGDEHPTKLVLPLSRKLCDGRSHDLELRTAAGQILARLSIVFPQYTPKIVGNFDGLKDGRVAGWVYDRNDESEPCSVNIFIDGVIAGQEISDKYRPDLASSNHRQGFAAFFCEIPRRFLDGRSHLVRVTVAGCLTELAGGGQNIEFPLYQPPSLNRFTAVKLPESEADPKSFNKLDPLTASCLANVAVAPVGGEALSTLSRRAGEVSIVIPVYNAAKAVTDCLASVAEHLSLGCEAIVIDDASTDSTVSLILAQYAQSPGFRVVKHETNKGYTRTVNEGTRIARGDVILLNSDTIVTAGWIEKLILSAYHSPSIGTVTAVSDNAGAFTVPNANSPTDVPVGLSRQEYARLVARVSDLEWPEVPTGNGFCMYVKRALLDEIGGFDEALFPRGYGEENDFCMRALKAGWKNIIDERVHIFHVRSQSFKDEKKALMDSGQRALVARHPEYPTLVRAFGPGTGLAAVRSRVRLLAPIAPPQGTLEWTNAMREVARPRILYVLHTFAEGGTTMTTFDLAKEVAVDFECFLLTVQGAALTLSRFADDVWVTVNVFTLSGKTDLIDAPREDYDIAILAILAKFDFDLIHVRHLMNHYLSLPLLAKRLGIPVVISFHDYWYVCPSVVLIDDQGKFCGGACTPGDGVCRTLQPLPDFYKPLKHGYVHTWRERVRQILPSADAYVTTSPTARAVYASAYPELAVDNFYTIEHGRRFEEQFHLAQAPQSTRPVRILVLGNVTTNGKGFEVARKLFEIALPGDIELLFLGSYPDEARLIGRVHGPYQRENLPSLLAELRPSVVAIFSMWAETYCHTLSESWQCGIPVIGSHLGAVGERIKEHGGGWAVDVSKPNEILDLIRRIRDDPEEYERQRGRAVIANVRRSKSMAADYRIVYKSVILRRRRDSELGEKYPIRVLAVCGSASQEPGIRLLEQIRVICAHPKVFHKVDLIVADALEIIQERLDKAPGGNPSVILFDRESVAATELSKLRSAVACPVLAIQELSEVAPLHDLIDDRPLAIARQSVAQSPRAELRIPNITLIVQGSEFVWSGLVRQVALALRGTRELLIVGERPLQSYGCPAKAISPDALGNAPADVLFSLGATTAGVILQGRFDPITLRQLAMLGVPLVVPAELGRDLDSRIKPYIETAAGGDAAAIAAATNNLTSDHARLLSLDADRGRTARDLWAISNNESRIDDFAALLSALARRKHPMTAIADKNLSRVGQSK